MKTFLNDMHDNIIPTLKYNRIRIFKNTKYTIEIIQHIYKVLEIKRNMCRQDTDKYSNIISIPKSYINPQNRLKF